MKRQREITSASRMSKTEISAGALLSAFALFCLFWVIPNFTAPAESELDLAPGFMPALAMWTCLALALMLIAKRVKQKQHKAPEVRDEEFGDEATGIGLNELINLSQWCVGSVVTILLLKYAGFEVAGFFTLSVLMFYAGQRNYLFLFTLSLLIPVFLSRLVWYAFSIELP